MSVRIGHWIAGEFETSGAEFESINPSKPSEVVAVAGGADVSLVGRAVQSAAESQREWARQAGAARAEALYKWADSILARSDELASAIVREVGKPIGEARGEVSRCVAILRYFAGEAVRETGSVIPALSAGSLQYSVRSPIGVVGLITPWNFPLAIPLWKAAPALAVGNSVVLKPAEESPLCASLLAETSTHLPKGIFNVVQGKGETGKALTDVADCISFTGSAEAGTQVAVACAGRNIKFQTEMGGKNPAIVLEDADLSLAAGLVAGGAMRFAGQKCTATSRVIVDKKIQGAFLDELRKAVDGLPVGDPGEASTAVGPVISEESRQRISEAVAKGIRLYRPPAAPTEGYFVAPSVLETEPADGLAQEELFGPVLAFIECDGIDQAIEIANSTRYGLSASIFTRDLRSAMQYVSRIEAGMVRVNADTTGVDPHAPFGGVKGSSSHTREQGPAAKEFYTEVKTVQINV